MTNRRCTVWTAVVAALVLLTGCAGLPTSSGVRAKQPIADAPTAQPADVEFYGPQSGAGPIDIVKGFLRANGSIKEGFGVAREFLTPEASKRWAPSGRVSINQGERDFVVSDIGPGRVRLTATTWAELDSSGHLKQMVVPSHRTVDIALAKVGGQWRISGLPADFGPYLSMTDFRDRTYAPYTVYLAERRTQTLVPDQQWFPRTGLATALARAVLRGAPEWVSQADGSAPDLNQVPGGTRLAVDAVPVSADGVATVELTDGVRKADSSTRTALWAAMMATLNQVPKVHRVTISVGGARLDSDQLPPAPVLPSDVGYSVAGPSETGLVTRTAQSLSWRTDGQSRRVPQGNQPPLPALDRNWYLLAADAEGDQVVGVSGDRSSLGRWARGADLYIVPTFGRQLTRPSFDYLDEIWVAGLALSNSGPDREVSSGATIWVMDAKAARQSARPQVVSAPWLGDSQVLSLKVARDGQRVVLVTRGANGKTKLLMSFVIRDANRQVTALAQPVEVGQSVTDVNDVGWLDEVTLAVIGRIGQSGAQQVIEVPLSGFVNPLGVVQGAQQIVATGRGTGDLFVITNKPGVQERIGGGWRVLPDVTDVIAPGS